jgi:predicted nuclease with TOPRIM domain
MTTRRQWRGNLSGMRAEKRRAIDQYPARRFPIQHEIQKLEDELNAFNERIEDLENEGHRSHVMEVLKANALDFASRIDELRCLLVESAPISRSCDIAPRSGNGSPRFAKKGP